MSDMNFEARTLGLDGEYVCAKQFVGEGAAKRWAEEHLPMVVVNIEHEEIIWEHPIFALRHLKVEIARRDNTINSFRHALHAEQARTQKLKAYIGLRQAGLDHDTTELKRQVATLTRRIAALQATKREKLELRNQGIMRAFGRKQEA